MLYLTPDQYLSTSGRVSQLLIFISFQWGLTNFFVAKDKTTQLEQYNITIPNLKLIDLIIELTRQKQDNKQHNR